MPLETIGVEVLRQTLAGQAPQSQSARWMDSLPSSSAHLVSCSHAIPEPRRTRHCRLKAVEPLRQSPQMAFWSSQISAVILAPFVQTCEAFLAPWCTYTRSWKLSFASQLFLCCLHRIPRTLEDICEISMSRSNLQEGTHVGLMSTHIMIPLLMARTTRTPDSSSFNVVCRLVRPAGTPNP